MEPEKKRNSDSTEQDEPVDRAVALDYDETEDEAPRVSAKGEGELAELIVELARENNVPLHEDPDLAEVLFKLDLDEQIPVSLYEAVAEVFAFLYRVNRREKGPEESPAQ